MACASKLVPRHPGRVQNTSISRNRVECGNVCLASPCPRTFPFDAPFVSLLVARRLRWCDMKLVDGSLSIRYGKLWHLPHQRAKHAQNGRTCSSATRAWNVLVNTMKSSIPDCRLDTAIWNFTATQHFACFQRQLHSLCVSHQHCTLHGLRGGGATDHWLQYRDVPQLRRRGRWTSEQRLVKGTFKKGRFYFIKTCSPKKLQTVSVLSESSPRFFAEQAHGESRHRPLQPPRCNGKSGGVYSVLRGGVEQRSFAHTVSPLGALPLPLSDVGRKQRTSRRRTRYEHRLTGMDMSSHANGSRGSLASVHSHKPANPSRVSAWCSRHCMCSFSGPSRTFF